MNRFLILVGVAVVAAAMYVAASPASQQSKGPTAKQFVALKKTVTAQGKTIKQLTKFDYAICLAAALGFLLGAYLMGRR